ncbi:DUF305 domain-containing protein [Micromonospora zamorensis]|uniref:DUF305 domain-containing protein n=1 Tax=Micromonospora zamorensis TaxID=709883 RepID=UPI0033B1F79D
MRTAVSASMSLFLAALLVTACADEAPTGTPPSTAATSTAGLSGSVSPSGSAGLFSATDIAWLQLTVAMNERLLPVLDMVPSRTTDPAWRTFAARLGTAHRADLSTARRLLAESGAPATNPHEGHDMPGMVTEQELTTLRSVTGVAFQRLADQHLRAHLRQAVRIATAEQRNGVYPATTALATEVVRAGNAELTRLDRLTP